MKNKARLRTVVLDYLGILLGCLIVSTAFTVLITPYKLVPGGVYGASIVLHNLMPGVQVGTFGLLIGVPLLVLSYLLLGKNVGVRTMVATVATPFMMNAITRAVYPDAAALRSLSPSLLCGGRLDCTHDMIVAVVVGCALIGLGEGIMVRCRATSGGSDTIAMLIHKLCGVKFSTALMGVDASVVCFGLVVIGFGLGTEAPTDRSWLLSGYSLICIFIMSRTAAFVISGTRTNKFMVVIIDKARGEDVREFILHTLYRTATVVPSSGLYSEEEKTTLLMVVRQREVDKFTTSIRSIDPSVFVIVTDAYDAYGIRWKEFPKEGQLQVS